VRLRRRREAEAKAKAEAEAKEALKREKQMLNCSTNA